MHVVCFHIVDLYLIFAMSLGLFPFFFLVFRECGILHPNVIWF